MPEAFCYVLHVKIVHAPCAWRTGGGVDSGRGALDWRWRWTLGGAVGALHRFVVVAGLK